MYSTAITPTQHCIYYHANGSLNGSETNDTYMLRFVLCIPSAIPQLYVIYFAEQGADDCHCSALPGLTMADSPKARL